MALTDTQVHTPTSEDISQNSLTILTKSATTIRTLAMDAIQKANSGHPGLPLGMADTAVVLWAKHLKHNPSNPSWPDRDRFVLSAGHGSMLLYSLLHLTGYDLPMSALKSFRQWESATPGHPEFGMTPGVETTTGPLGQGLANAVGMALAERLLAAQFNRSGFELVNHFTYVIASDGDLMEGISHEACALAGHLKLGKLIVLYDDNGISIDGSTDLTFSEDVLARFRAYGWHTQAIDGHDMNQVDSAITAAKSETRRPSMIACKTVIGFGSPNRAGTSKAHGEPLGVDEVRLTKENLSWPSDSEFYVPEDVYEFMRTALQKGAAQQAKWEALLTSYENSFPDLSVDFHRGVKRELPPDWDKKLPEFTGEQAIATRAASGKFLNAVSPGLSQLVGGSADLTGSNITLPGNETHVTPDDFTGRYIYFGVREHGMGGVLNGMALHGGLIPYGGTFLVFSDYMRPSIRLAALMELQVIYVFTHDSIGLGEDGPTHQPIEHLTSLRAIPNLVVIRPADAGETTAAWRTALQRQNGPTALILTRQKLPVFDPDRKNSGSVQGVQNGAYVLDDSSSPKVILLATGSEVHVAVEAKKLLAEKQVPARVVSMPSSDLFDRQPHDYREKVLPAHVRARVAVETGITSSWHKYVGEFGEIVGIDRFGASAPYQEIYDKFGITPRAVADAAMRSIDKAQKTYIVSLKL
ncbi:MAG: transketolase [bacterium]